AEATDFDKQNESIFDLTDQLLLPTETWGLSRWEKILNVPRESGDTDEIRRYRLISKKSNKPPNTYRANEQAVNRLLKNTS
ncbi:putative phage tail protein, partial [Bacillus subtilis]|uniref:putative phage tail protein n=1 Tax=Bacillus subtilis TaxID=1423 RepID=UPI0024ACA857